MIMKSGTINWKVLIIPAILAALVLAFSQSSLWLGDEITYNYNFKDGSQITSLSDVVTSQIEHYKTINGRTVAHSLCQIYIPFLGKTAFSVSNAIVWVALLLMMASLFNIKYDDWKMMALLACLVFLGFRTKFTPTCQIGYPWMFALVTGYLLILRKFSKEQQSPWKWYNLIWAAPFAFIAGWSQEALVIGVGAALGLMALLNIKRVTLSQWVLLVCFAAGVLLVCLSPPNLERSGGAPSSSTLLPPVIMSFVKFFFYLRITYLLIIFVLYFLISKKAKLKELIYSAWFYWVIWAVMLAFNFFISVYGNRQLFGMEYAAIAIIVKYVQLYILPENDKYKKACNILLTVLAVWVAVVAVGNTRYLIHHSKVLNYIDSSYKASADGIVYYDFSAKDVTFQDTYPSDAFTWHALNSLGRSYGNHKRLQVVPQLCSGLNQSSKDNGWEKIAKGAIAIVVNKHNPPTGIIVKRSLFGKHFSDMWVSMDEPVFENENNLVLLIYEKLPLVKNNSVEFEL